MQTVLKTLLAITLGFGFLALEAYAKPSLAFLGFNRESDPLIRENLSSRIQFELAADSGLTAISQSEVAALFAKGILTESDITPLDMPRLGKELGAQYYAFGRLPLPVAVSLGSR